MCPGSWILSTTVTSYTRSPSPFLPRAFFSPSPPTRPSADPGAGCSESNLNETRSLLSEIRCSAPVATIFGPRNHGRATEMRSRPLELAAGDRWRRRPLGGTRFKKGADNLRPVERRAENPCEREQATRPEPGLSFRCARRGVHSARIYVRVFTGQDGARLPPLRALTPA